MKTQGQSACFWAPLPSLEIRWLAKHDRQLPTPRIGFSPDLPIGGMHISQHTDPVFAEGIEIPPSNGTIIVGTCWGPDLPVAAIIAHEWRHHWQDWNGWEYDGGIWDQAKNYETAIREYYRSKSEMDALQYEILRAPCENSLEARALAIRSAGDNPT